MKKGQVYQNQRQQMFSWGILPVGDVDVYGSGKMAAIQPKQGTE